MPITKSKVWCFGDSYTQGYNHKVDWCKSYIDFKGYTPKVYCDFLSEKLETQGENLGVGGYDNYSIFEVLCKNIDRIKEDDIVIIGWSNVTRFRMASKDNDWVRFVPGTITDFHIKHHTDLSKDTIEEICVNRDNQVYFNEVNSWIKFINHTMKQNKIIHWTPFDNNLNLNAHKILKLETTRMESNGLINDDHYSENSHKKLSDMFFEILKNKLI